MAFKAKTDYCGLATGAGEIPSNLEIRDDAENKTSQVYRAVSNEGEIFAEEVYGEDSAPTNSYALKGDITTLDGVAFHIGVGAVRTVNDKKYALESVTINTASGSPVAISATAQLLEDDAATTGAKFAVPEFTLYKRHIAQDIFGAIASVTNATTTSLNHQIACTITKDPVVGNIVSSDANSGLITITGTLLQKSTSGADPTITLEQGWTLAQAPSRTNPESAYPEFSFTIIKPLALATV